MKIEQRHPWSLTAEEAIAIQHQLSAEVIAEDRLGSVNYVAGIDAGYDSAEGMTRAAVAVLSFPDLRWQDSAIARRPTTFPCNEIILNVSKFNAIPLKNVKNLLRVFDSLDFSI